MPKYLHFNLKSCSFASYLQLVYLLTRAHTPFLSSQRRALLIPFFSYVQKGLRVVNVISWMCATKMELREIKRSLSKQKPCRVTKVGLKRLVYFCKHAWEGFCSKKANLARCWEYFEGIFFPSTVFWKLLSRPKTELLNIYLCPDLNLLWRLFVGFSFFLFFSASKDTKSKSAHCNTQWVIFFKSTYECQIKWHTYSWQLVVERYFYHLPFTSCTSWLDEDVQFRS